MGANMKLRNFQFHFAYDSFNMLRDLPPASHAALQHNCHASRMTCMSVSLQMLPHAASTAATRERVASDRTSMDLAAAAAQLFAVETSERRLLTAAATSALDLRSCCCTACCCCSTTSQTSQPKSGLKSRGYVPAAAPPAPRLYYSRRQRTEQPQSRGRRTRHARLHQGGRCKRKRGSLPSPPAASLHPA